MDVLTAELTPAILAEVLQEPEKALLARCLRQLGQERCAAILAAALEVESAGGMLIKSGARRRTPGGTFFELTKERCSSKERHFIFAVLAGKKPPGTLHIPRIAETPVTLTIANWKGLTPMPVNATLKLVLREIPETRERGDMVYLALQNEPRGVPNGISLDSGPLYLTAPVKQWRTACTRATEIRATGIPALLIVEAHVSSKEGALIGVVKGIQVVEGKAAVPQAG